MLSIEQMNRVLTDADRFSEGNCWISSCTYRQLYRQLGMLDHLGRLEALLLTRHYFQLWELEETDLTD